MVCTSPRSSSHPRLTFSLTVIEAAWVLWLMSSWMR